MSVGETPIIVRYGTRSNALLLWSVRTRELRWSRETFDGPEHTGKVARVKQCAQFIKKGGGGG